MSTWLRLWTKVKRAARGVFLDLFGEDTPRDNPGSQPGDEMQPGLEQLQARLDEMVSELARVTASHQRFKVEQRIAAEALADLDAQIDQAVLQGAEEQARSQLHRPRKESECMDDRAASIAEYARVIAGTRASLEKLRGRLDGIRQQQAELRVRARDAAALEKLALDQRELGRDLDSLQTGLAQRGEQTARNEDQVAGLRKVEKQDRE
jgi:hypothetical protein